VISHEDYAVFGRTRVTFNDAGPRAFSSRPLFPSALRPPSSALCLLPIHSAPTPSTAFAIIMPRLKKKARVLQEMRARRKQKKLELLRYLLSCYSSNARRGLTVEKDLPFQKTLFCQKAMKTRTQTQTQTLQVPPWTQTVRKAAPRATQTARLVPPGFRATVRVKLVPPGFRATVRVKLVSPGFRATVRVRLVPPGLRATQAVRQGSRATWRVTHSAPDLPVKSDRFLSSGRKVRGKRCQTAESIKVEIREALKSGSAIC
jgi:exonuclease VII large subunit